MIQLGIDQSKIDMTIIFPGSHGQDPIQLRWCCSRSVGAVMEIASFTLFGPFNWKPRFSIENRDMRDPRCWKYCSSKLLTSWCLNKSLWFVVFKNIQRTVLSHFDRASSKSNPSSPGRSSAWSPRMLARTSSLRYWASGAFPVKLGSS